MMCVNFLHGLPLVDCDPHLFSCAREISFVSNSDKIAELVNLHEVPIRSACGLLQVCPVSSAIEFAEKLLNRELRSTAFRDDELPAWMKMYRLPGFIPYNSYFGFGSDPPVSSDLPARSGRRGNTDSSPGELGRTSLADKSMNDPAFIPPINPKNRVRTL